MEREILKLSHITDTHYCKSYQGNMMEAAFAKGKHPEKRIRKMLQKAVDEKVDALIVSGDIVHEGCEEDYRAFRQMVTETVGNGIKVFYACGNHDRKDAFCRGLKMQYGSSSIDYVDYVKGYRIVVLDSAVEGQESGRVGEDQTRWLKQVLEKPYGNGTIVTFHHPVAWDMPQLAMPVDNTFAELLSAGDVVGIFCGHTHSNNICNWKGIPQFTADSTTFGMEMDQKNFLFVEKCGMSFYHIAGKQVSVHVESFHTHLPVMAEIPVAEMMKYIK